MPRYSPLALLGVLALGGCVFVTQPSPDIECPLTSAQIDELLPGNSGTWKYRADDVMPSCSISVDGSDDYWYGGTYWINWSTSQSFEERSADYDSLGSPDGRPDAIIWATDYSDRVEIGYLADVEGTVVQFGYRGPLRGSFSISQGDAGEALATIDSLYAAAERSGWRGVLDR